VKRKGHPSAGPETALTVAVDHILRARPRRDRERISAEPYRCVADDGESMGESFATVVSVNAASASADCWNSKGLVGDITGKFRSDTRERADSVST